MMCPKTSFVKLDDRLILAKAEFGDPAGEPWFYFHGFPGSRLEAALLDSVAAARNLRFIALDRPGYGESPFVPGRTLQDWPTLLLQVADVLHIERFSVLGISGGGPYAYACARYLDDTRLDQVALVCALGPYAARDAVMSMNAIMRSGIQLTHAFPALGTAVYRLLAALVFSRDPKAILKVYLRHAAPADREAMADPERRAIFRNSSSEAFRQGGRGPAHDLRLYTTDWGFSLSEISRPVFLWHGEQDRTVPCAFSRYAVETLQQGTLQTFPDDGHFSLPLCHIGEILDALHTAADTGKED